MANHVFILGAGASQSCGAPLMDNFMDQARYLHATGKISKSERVFEVIGELQLAHSKGSIDLYNIETLFNALEMGRLMGGFSRFNSNEMESIIRDYTAMIVDTINASVKYRIFNNQISAPEDYNQFCASLQASISGGQDYPHHSASIITFNYDLAIDLALSQFSSAGMKPVYCLSEPEIHEPGLKLLKLHGSLNWFRSCRDNSILVCNISDYTRRTWQFPERISSSEFDFTKVMAEDLGSESTGVPFIVAPSWNKTSLSSGLSHVWKCAKDELMRADHIHIIGYSMPQTDGYFPYLYSLGTISNRPLSSITIYNPDKSPEMKSRFTNLFGAGVKSRVRFEVVKFQEALSIINKKLQMAS